MRSLTEVDHCHLRQPSSIARDVDDICRVCVQYHDALYKLCIRYTSHASSLIKFNLGPPYPPSLQAMFQRSHESTSKEDTPPWICMQSRTLLVAVIASSVLVPATFISIVRDSLVIMTTDDGFVKTCIIRSIRRASTLPRSLREAAGGHAFQIMVIFLKVNIKISYRTSDLERIFLFCVVF